MSCVLMAAALAVPPLARGQQQGSGVTAPPPPIQVIQPQIDSSTYKGSAATGKVTPGTLPLSLDDAIQRGLRHNLGLLLTTQTATTARGNQLDQLQSLLPTVKGKLTEAVQESDLQAEGLRVPGFPSIIGPYGYTDLRGTFEWSLLNLSDLQNYLAAKHDFAASKLSAEDARNMVVLTVGNAYLLVVADKATIAADQAEVATAEISLNQAIDEHNAGTTPRLDVLRAQVDYQTEEQNLISARNAFQKDKIALARAIGLPLEQKFIVTDTVPYAPLDHISEAQAVQQALANRKDLQAMQQKAEAAEHARHAATDERLPTVKFNGDYGDIGVNLAHSHGTGDATGSLNVPIFEEFKLRGDAQKAQAQLDQQQDQLSNLRGQITADVDDALLDMQSSEKQVEVARSNESLAKEALKEAQERYQAGVSDNLAVSQAQQALAQADAQYVSSLYAHNVAKLSLARAMGVADGSYKTYLGGK
jgi:outer membrane protein TolC